MKKNFAELESVFANLRTQSHGERDVSSMIMKVSLNQWKNWEALDYSWVLGHLMGVKNSGLCARAHKITGRCHQNSSIHWAECSFQALSALKKRQSV